MDLGFNDFIGYYSFRNGPLVSSHNFQVFHVDLPFSSRSPLNQIPYEHNSSHLDLPHQPSVTYFRCPIISLHFINPLPRSSCIRFTLFILIYNIYMFHSVVTLLPTSHTVY